MRASEYTSPSPFSNNPQLQLQISDISVTKSSLSVAIKHCKTNQFGKPLVASIGANQSSTCPMRAITKFLKVRKPYGPGPLFVLHSERFLTRNDVSRMTKRFLHLGGYNVTSFSSHSYCIGAATSAAMSGLPDHLIQALGRWRSDVYRDYIRTPSKRLSLAAQSMSTT